MKRLCLTFALLFLSASLVPATAYSATSHSKKKSTKSAKKKTTKKAPKKQTSSEAQTTDIVQTVERNHGIPRAKLAEAYNYAKELYAGKQYDKAKDVFKKIALAATDSDLNANSLYLFSQCAFHTEDFIGCIKALNILAKRWPDCPIIKTGYVARFCSYIINDEANLQTSWDYLRFESRFDDKGKPVWKESIPPGFKLKRINFKLAFGCYRVLSALQPNSPQTTSAKQELDTMLNAPITMVWVDEKAPPTRYGHPADFFSIFSLNEKKGFSKIICDRMFYDWESDRLYQFLNMYDDVRNLKPRFVARSKTPEETPVQPGPPITGNQVLLPQAAGPSAVTPEYHDPLAVLTLSKLFQVSGYNPYSDSYTNVIEASPLDSNL